MNKINNNDVINEMAKNILLNSLLSYKVYWGAIKSLESNGEKEKVFADHLNKNVEKYIKPISLFDKKIFNSSGEEIEVNQKNGVYKLSKIDLVETEREEETRFSCGFFESNIDGEKKLHIVFRGTEPNYKNKLKYFLYDYMNMKRHYKVFEPLLEEVMAYAKKNNIKNIDVAGHSLGGAMVDIFMKGKNKSNLNFKFKGYTFGNPFGEQSLQGIMDKFDAIKESIQNKTKNTKFHAITKVLDFPPLLILVPSAVGNIAHNHWTLLKSLMRTKKIDKDAEYVNAGADVTSVNNVSDPVVNLGAMLFKTNGNRVILKENHLPKNHELGSFESIMFNHSMANYINSFVNRIDSFSGSELFDFIKEEKAAFNKKAALNNVKAIKADCLEINQVNVLANSKL